MVKSEWIFLKENFIGNIFPLRCEIWQVTAFSDGLLKTRLIRNKIRGQGKHLEPAKSS